MNDIALLIEIGSLQLGLQAMTERLNRLEARLELHEAAEQRNRERVVELETMLRAHKNEPAPAVPSGALIAAELDRMQRAEDRKGAPTP